MVEGDPAPWTATESVGFLDTRVGINDAGDWVFATNTDVPGLGLVPDVNVAFNDAGTWSMHFDGTAHGLTAGTAQDLDALSLPSGITPLYLYPIGL